MSACNAGDLSLIPGLGRSLEKEMAVFLPGESHGQRSLVGYSPQGSKGSDTTERLHFTSLHLEMTHYESESHLMIWA